MNKLLVALIPGIFALSAYAQTVTPSPEAQPYGKVDMADLKMTNCDFEKDANAEVLFNVGNIYWYPDLKSIVKEVHKRIKIFNVNGNNEANVHIEFTSYNRLEDISNIEAETINLVNGQAEITKLDKKAIFTTVVDKEKSEITFAMPNVKPGCIVEYRYKWSGQYNTAIPYWYFQEDIPVRYCELSTSIPDIFYFRPEVRISQPMVKHSEKMEAQVLQVMTHTRSETSPTSTQETETYPYSVDNELRAMSNIPSLHTDAYTSSFADNVQYVGYHLISVKPIGGFNSVGSDTWGKVGRSLIDDDDFGSQLNRKLKNEDEIVGKAKALKSDDEKIAYIFNTVKNAMKWNGYDRWYTSDGTVKAWDNKSGNSTEINLIVYHLLKQAGVAAYPMVVSTRKNGKVDKYTTSLYQFNRAVAYVPVDSTRSYVLDASGKYNLYNEIPSELLNSMTLYIDKSKKTFDTVTFKKDISLRQVVLINAEVKPGGKLEGTAQINSSSYDKINTTNRYKTDGEEKYIKYLADGDNGLKISSVSFQNMEVDTLPLTQNIAFNMDLAGSDENYIYLNPNLFTQLKTNPFLSETRMTDVYFAYKRNYSINGVYKIPAGYKTDALPKSVSMVIPDKSIVFKRVVAEQDGAVLVHFIIDYRQPAYHVEQYQDLRVFYKKMYELLNEQVVFKKI